MAEQVASPADPRHSDRAAGGGDEVAWTTPLWAIETLLKEFPCIKAVQIVEWRCAYYSDFGGDLDLAVPANLRYLAEVLKLCGRHGKHLSLQIQTDMAHLASDRLAGPLRELFREYRAYVLPQNKCIPPSYYLTQAAAWGLWLAGYCEHWGIEPQWWWWTKGESYFIRPGVFGTEAELETEEDSYARLYRAFIIEGALMGATVFSIEPPQDIWHGEAIDERHFGKVIYPTLKIAEHADVTSQDLAQFGAAAVEGLHFHQGPGQQGTEHKGQGLCVRAALAAEGRAEQSGQRVTRDAFGQCGVGEGQGLAERIGQGGIGTGRAAGLGGWRRGNRSRLWA